jgi:hypothetical protein
MHVHICQSLRQNGLHPKYPKPSDPHESTPWGSHENAPQVDLH